MLNRAIPLIGENGIVATLRITPSSIGNVVTIEIRHLSAGIVRSSSPASHFLEKIQFYAW